LTKETNDSQAAEQAKSLPGPGRILKARRNELGMTVEDVARATRLTNRTVLLLEADHYDEMPAPVYVKGFIRSYAELVGLNEDELVRRFEETRRASVSGPEPGFRFPSRKRTSTILILVLAVALLFWIVLLLVSPTGEEPEPSNLSPVGNGYVPPDRGAAEPHEMVLEVLAAEPTWIKVETDGAKPVHYRLEKGQKLVLRARARFNLLVGDAEAVALLLNGEHYPVPESPGKTVNIRIPER